MKVPLTGLLLVALAALSGCASPQSEPASDPLDEPRETVSGSVGGTQRDTREIDVPTSATVFLVKAQYSADGSARFELFDPSGRLAKADAPQGGTVRSDDAWFRSTNPTPGIWRFTIDIDGGVVYTFGFYWDDVDASAPAETATKTTDSGSTQGVFVASAAVTGLAFLAVLATEFGRYRALGALAGLGLFSRIEKEEVLAHTTREQVYQFIRENAGPSFSDLKRSLQISNGTLVHHLRILEAQEFIRAQRDGFRTRFYVRGPKVEVTAYVTRTQRHILDTVLRSPGVTQKELAKALGLPREAVSYHTKRLAAHGQLQVRQEGKWRRYWAPATVESAKQAAKSEA